MEHARQQTSSDGAGLPPDGESPAQAARRYARELRDAAADEATATRFAAPVARGLAVGEIVAGLGADPQIVTAATLYPLFETQLLSGPAIAERFGEEVLTLMRQLKRFGEFALPARWSSGQSLDAQQAEALRKMLVAVVDDVRLVLVRLADQLYRLRSLKQAPEEERRQAALETREVYAPLANRLGMWQLKWELEDLAFRYLEPETYMQIAKWLQERRADREQYIAELIETLRQELAKAGVRADIAGRPKHIYSIYRKMLRKQVDFEHVFDVRAVRVLADTTADCYAALGVVHGMWHYIPGEFDDYIANPKENDYRSLHTAVIGPGGKTVEIQIRTPEMHRHAELGVAAHWKYKEGGKDDETFRRKINWLRQLLEPEESGESDGDFIDRVRSEIFEDRVYVLTPEGDVVDLPNGATPLDFAYHVHTELGHRCRGARIRGRLVPLTYKLSNGEQVEIITSGKATPSRDWLIPQLGYLASNRARAKVRHWFRRVQQEHKIEQGQAMLERELAKLGVSSLHVNLLAKELKAHSATDLYAAVGAGDVTLSDVDQAVQALTSPQPRAEPEAPVQRRRAARADHGGSAITVDGVGDLLTNFAQCCKPLPPDEIAGYLTQGRGISIHRNDCPNLLNLLQRSRERVLEVCWRMGAPQTFPADVRIEAHDRRGLVKDVSTLLATEKVNILTMETRTDKANLSAVMTLTIEVASLDELSTILHRLGRIPNVTYVRRVS